MRPDYLTALIRVIGIPTTAGRSSAIRQHVLEMPSPVVADALGYAPGTTARLAAQSAATFSRYAPGEHQRRHAAPGQAKEAMTASPLPAALRAASQGLYAIEAATGLIIAHGTWLARDDFGLHPPRHRDGGDRLGSRDRALDAGQFPSSAGEKRMLRLAASLADRAPVSLGDAVTGIDDRNLAILIDAVRHASGRRQFPDRAAGRYRMIRTQVGRENSRQSNTRSHQ